MAQSVTVLVSGPNAASQSVVVQNGATFQAISYQRYTLLVDGKERLPAGARLWREGNELKLRLADGTQITFADWGVCDGATLQTGGAQVWSEQLGRFVDATQLDSWRFTIVGSSEVGAGEAGTAPAPALVALAPDGAAAADAAATGRAAGGFGGSGVLLGLGGLALLGAAAGGGGGGSSSGGGATGTTPGTGTGGGTTPAAAPAAPSQVALAAASDSGVVGDALTNVRTPTLQGRGDAGSTIEIRNAAGTLLATTTVDAAGNWSVATNAALPEGLTTFSVLANRGTGTTNSAAVPFALTVDATAPTAPAAALQEGTVVGQALNADGLVANVRGSFAAGDTVTLRLSRPDGSAWTGSRVATAGEAAAGVAQFAIPAQTLDGAYAVAASATDGAGNASAFSGALAVTIDLQRPTFAGGAAPVAVNEGFAAYEITAASLGATDNLTPRANLAVTSATLKSSSAFTAADLVFSVAGGKLSVAPSAAGANRNGAFVVSVTVADQAGNSSVQDVTFSVAAVNDAPAGQDATLQVAVGTPYTFFARDFALLDAADTPANALQSVVISSLPTLGQLRFNGVAVTVGQEIASSDLDANRLVYTPGAGALGSNYASFTFQVRDNGGTANGGVNLDPTPNRATFNVVDANDAPVLNSARAPAFSTPEYTFSGGSDAALQRPSGANPAGVFTAGTLVDFAVPAGQVDNVTDPDAGAKLGIGVTQLSGRTPGATLWYSVDSGASWDWITNKAGSRATSGFFGADGVAGGSDDSVLLLADTARLVFDAGNSARGTSISDALTIRAWDQTAGANGATVVSPAIGNTTALSLAIDTVQANFTSRVIDLTRLDAAAGVRIAGGTAGAQFGFDVSGAGDVNGDGFADFAIAQYGTVASSGGNVSLVHGRADSYGAVAADGTRTADVGALTRSTFTRPGEFMTGVAGLGDFNNDGYADLMIGADLITGTGAGGAYVVFGGPDVGDIPRLALTSSGAGWFRISDSFYGIGQQSHTISWTGDVNGDGYDDLIVGAKLAPAAGPSTFGSGMLAVVYGHAGRNFGANNTLDLAPFGVDPTTLADTGGVAGHVFDAATNTRGIVIGAGPAGNGLAWASSVGGLGDRNGDGYADFASIDDLGGTAANGIVLHGKLTTDTAGNVLWFAGPAGQDWVGKGTTTNTGVNSARIRLGGLGGDVPPQGGADGVRITAQSVGDVNGDGYDDFAMAYNGVRNGEVYIIYGNGTVLADSGVAALASGTGGFKITGGVSGDRLGESVHALGDVNGDGFDDFIIGAPRAEVGAATDQGSAYLIYGGLDPGANDIDLAVGLAASRGIAIRGSTTGDQAGYSVSGAGDVNGDGLGDFLIGAPLADGAASDAGAVYLIYGTTAYGNSGAQVGSTLSGGGGVDSLVGTAGADSLSGGGGADAISAGAGNDTLTIGNNGFRRLDGGAGFDTLRIGASMSLDFTSIGAGVGQNLSGRSHSLERIDLVAGAQTGTLRIAAQDVYQLVGDFDVPTGGTLSGRQENTLVVVGDASDTVTFAEGIGGASGWIATGAIAANPVGDGNSYALYQRGTANVYVDARISMADTIVGTTGNDTLVGGLGVDSITGGAGNDTLYGGLLGSTGATSQAAVRDVFAMSLSAGLAQGNDVVKDFQRGVDRVYLTDTRNTYTPDGGLTVRDITQADSPTQYLTLGNDGNGNVRLTLVSGGATSTLTLEGVLYEATANANNGRYGSLAELFGTNETRLLYLTADPFSGALASLP